MREDGRQEPELKLAYRPRVGPLPSRPRGSISALIATAPYGRNRKAALTAIVFDCQPAAARRPAARAALRRDQDDQGRERHVAVDMLGPPMNA